MPAERSRLGSDRIRRVPPATTERRLLIVDDNHDQRTALAEALRSMSWQVDEARDGHTAIGLATTRPPMIAITELMLPDMQGFRLARTLRKIVGEELLVVALTRLDHTGIHSLARMAGIGEVILKPASPHSLNARLVEVLGARDQHLTDQ